MLGWPRRVRGSPPRPRRGRSRNRFREPTSSMRAMLLACLLVTPGFARPLTEVPSPRPAGWVSDTVGMLDASTRQRLNQELEQFHRRQKSEFAVVVVDSADGMPSKQYAHELFNRWGVGRAGQNDGVLFVVFERDHRMEVEVGEGCRQLMSDDKTSQILQSVVVPQFKAGHAPQGLTAGVAAICVALTPVDRIEDSGHLLKEDERAQLRRLIQEKESQGLRVFIHLEPSLPRPESFAHNWLGRQAEPYSTVVLVGDGRKRILAQESGGQFKPGGAKLTQLKRKEPWGQALAAALTPSKAGRHIPVTAPVLVAAPIPAPAMTWPRLDPSYLWGGAIASLGLGAALMARRHTPRKCPKCKIPMTRMSESQEDKYLDKGQQAEERHGSVDYDVWVCGKCDCTKIQRYAAWTSSLKVCGRCNYRTSERIQVVIDHATEHSEGRGRNDVYCRHCGHTVSDYYTIARIIPSESTDSSSSRSSDSCDSSSSSSGFSGGSSEGGGSGASW